MKLIIAFALLAVVVARPEDTYDSKYDNFNVDEVLENERLFLGYVNCFEGKGKCTAEGNQIKEWIPEGIKTSCGKCTEKQKVLVAKTLSATKVKYPDVYENLMQKNNPDGKYDEALAAFLAKHLST